MSYDANSKLDEVERGLLGSCKQAILTNQTYAFGGVVPVPVSRGGAATLRVYYDTEDSDGKEPHIGCITLPCDELALTAIKQASLPCPQAAKDSGSTKAFREIMSPNFALGTDLLSNSAILANIANRLSLNFPVRAEIHKMEIHGQGAVSKYQGSASRGRDHLGTLTLYLPTTYSGGESVIAQNEGTSTTTFDFSTKLLKDLDHPSIGWSFHRSTCQHEVQLVQSGTRLTITYDIYETSPHADYKLDLSLDPISTTLFDMVRSPSFLPQGGTIGFAFRYTYPRHSEGGDWSNFSELANLLIGSDATLLSGLKQIGLDHNFTAIYDTYDGQYWDGTMIFSEFTDLGEGSVEEQDDWGEELLGPQGDYVKRNDVVWVCEPDRMGRGYENAFVDCWRSTPVQDYVRFAIGILVNVPPLDERRIPETLT